MEFLLCIRTLRCYEGNRCTLLAVELPGSYRVDLVGVGSYMIRLDRLTHQSVPSCGLAGDGAISLASLSMLAGKSGRDS